MMIKMLACTILLLYFDVLDNEKKNQNNNKWCGQTNEYTLHTTAAAKTMTFNGMNCGAKAKDSERQWTMLCVCQLNCKFLRALI